MPARCSERGGHPELRTFALTPTDPTPTATRVPAESTADPQVDVASFLVRLARALHTYGTPSHRTEQALVRIAERLGVRGQFLVTPTSILAAIGDEEGQILRLSRIDPGETDLQKLTRVHQVIRDVFEGVLPIRAARKVLEDIETSRPAYGPWLAGVAFTAASATAARFFDGGLLEILGASIAGALVGIVNLIGGRSERVSRLLPAISGMLSAIVAGVFASTTGAFAPIVLLGSLIVLVPGLTLTVAMNELALGHVVSGSARLTGATVTFLQLGFGAALGNEIATRWVGPSATAAVPSHLPEWSLAPALVITTFALVVLFRARGRDTFVVFAMATIAYASSRFGAQAFGPELGAAVGALCLGVAANVASRWLDQPTAIAIVPALLLLVPGSLGFRSLQALMAKDVVGGIESLVTMAVVAIALVSGLLVANVLMKPRRLL